MQFRAVLSPSLAEKSTGGAAPGAEAALMLQSGAGVVLEALRKTQCRMALIKPYSRVSLFTPS